MCMESHYAHCRPQGYLSIVIGPISPNTGHRSLTVTTHTRHFSSLLSSIVLTLERSRMPVYTFTSHLNLLSARALFRSTSSSRSRTCFFPHFFLRPFCYKVVLPSRYLASFGTQAHSTELSKPSIQIQVLHINSKMLVPSNPPSVLDRFRSHEWMFCRLF